MKLGLRFESNIKEWNKNSFGFTNKKMPQKCPDCSKKMSNIKYGFAWDRYNAGSNYFFRDCICGALIIWAWPGIFVRRHTLPLFDIDRRELK